MGIVDTKDLFGGYRSSKDKQKLVMWAGIIGALLFVAQSVAPVLLMLPAYGGMFYSLHLSTRTNVSRSTSWKGQLWYTKAPAFNPFDSDSEERVALMRIDPSQGAKAETVLETEIWKPWLLADEDRLWLIAYDEVLYYREDKLKAVPVTGSLGEICRPFMYKGTPAVVEADPMGQSLRILEAGEWKKVDSLDLNLGPTRFSRAFQAVESGGTLHVFMRHGNALMHHRGWPGESTEDEWEGVTEFGRQASWTAMDNHGEPAIIVERSSHAIIYKIEDGTWHPTARMDAQWMGDVMGGPLEDRDSYAVLWNVDGGGLRTAMISGDVITAGASQGPGIPFPFIFIALIFLMFPLMVLVPLVFTLPLSRVIWKYKRETVEVGEDKVKLARLTKRLLAYTVDESLIGLPFMLACLYGIVGIWDPFTAFAPPWIYVFLALLAASPLWSLSWRLIMCLQEGRTGRTPGNSLARIRVLGIDGKPCGFGRSFLRWLVLHLDMHFGGLVGLFLMAFTRRNQRAGDIVARTTVIEASSNSTQ